MFYFHMNSLKDALREKYEEKNKKGWRFIDILAVTPLLGMGIGRDLPFPNILLQGLIIILFKGVALICLDLWNYRIPYLDFLRHSPNKDGANKKNELNQSSHSEEDRLHTYIKLL